MVDKILLSLACVVVLALGGCSRQQSDWQKAREANTTDSYEQFLKKYPTGEFTAQAEARVKDLYLQRDWEKARDADTPDAYQAFLKQYPDGRLAEEARIRIENFNLAQTPSGPGAAPGAAVSPGASEAPAAITASSASPGNPSAPGANAPSPAKAPPIAAEKAASVPARAPKARTAAIAAAKRSGPYGIQLGAFKSGSAAAHQRWAHLRREYPKLLAGLSSKVVPKKTPSGTLYRLEATGVSEQHARLICKSLKARSQACVVIRTTRV
jgi:cell division protein FtsN